MEEEQKNNYNDNNNNNNNQHMSEPTKEWKKSSLTKITGEAFCVALTAAYVQRNISTV